jgi:hypothetical protein
MCVYVIWMTTNFLTTSSPTLMIYPPTHPSLASLVMYHAHEELVTQELYPSRTPLSLSLQKPTPKRPLPNREMRFGCMPERLQRNVSHPAHVPFCSSFPVKSPVAPRDLRREKNEKEPNHSLSSCTVRCQSGRGVWPRPGIVLSYTVARGVLITSFCRPSSAACSWAIHRTTPSPHCICTRETRCRRASARWRTICPEARLDRRYHRV